MFLSTIPDQCERKTAAVLCTESLKAMRTVPSGQKCCGRESHSERAGAVTGLSEKMVGRAVPGITTAKP